MEMFHAERYALARDIFNNPEPHEAALKAWLFLHGDIFKE